MSSSPNAFFIDTAARQGWLSVEQVVAAQQVMAGNPDSSICDYFLQQRWLGPEHVEWLRQMETLRRTGQKLKSFAPSSSDGVSAMAATHSLSVSENRYEVGGMVAQGGMGAILQATDASINRTVAMKVMLGETQARSDQIQRFINEAKITGQLEHPSIVPIYDMGTDRHGTVFYTMKFVRGINLHDVLGGILQGNTAMIARYPLGHLLTIYQKVCDAMAFAHSKHVVHRDLKPENIMIGEYGEVLVMDWGLAKVLGTREGTTPHPVPAAAAVVNTEGEFHTMVGSVLGTPYFMAPEQAEGRLNDIDARTDIWALGGILYSILTLQTPVMGETLEELLHKISHGTILPPSSFNRSAPLQFPHCPDRVIPDSLSAVVMKALSVSRRRRYQTVQDLQKDIGAYQGGFATSAESAGMFKQLALLIKRHKAEASLLAVGFLLVVALTSFFIRTLMISNQRANMERDKAQANERKASDKEAEARANEKKANDNLARALAADTLAAERKKEVTEKSNEVEAKTKEVATEKQKASEFEKRADQKAQEAAAKAKEAADKAQEVALAKQKAEMSEKLAAELKKSTAGKLAAGDAVAFFDSARLQIEARKFDEALEKINRAIVFNPNEAEYLCLKGNILESLLRIKEARDAYNEALLRNSNHALARENLSLCDKLLKDNPGKKDLLPASIRDLAVAMNNQKRIAEALAMRQLVGKDKQLDMDACRNVLETEGLWPLMQKAGRSIDVDASGMLQLDFSGLPIEKLPPLKDLPIAKLILASCKINDLNPLKGMPLTHLSLQGSPAHDLNPLKGMSLETLCLDDSKVDDLIPLKGMPLKNLSLANIPSTDIGALKGMPLETLSLKNVQTRDFSALKDMPLKSLTLNQTQIANLNVLKGMPLATLWIASCRLGDLGPLKDMPITDLDANSTLVSDLNPLKGMPLISLNLNHTRTLSNITALKGMPLTRLLLAGTNVNDLSPLKDALITHLDLSGVPAADLSALSGMPLKELLLHDCPNIKDLAPLAGCKDLERITVPAQCKKVDALRNLPKLRFIDTKWDTDDKMMKAEDFFKKYDGGKK